MSGATSAAHRAAAATRRASLVTHLPRHDWIAVRRFTPDLAAPRRPVVHDHASVVLYLGGHARFWMQGAYALGAGDVLLIPEGAPHYLVEASAARAIGVSLCPSCAPGPARTRLAALLDAVGRGGCAMRRLAAADVACLEGVLLQLERELAERRAGSDLAVEAYLALLTVLLLRATEPPVAELRHDANPVVSRALEFVHRRGTSGISLRDVAEHVARSPAHVASLVKDATGETVVGWITRARMSECRQLLLHTDEPVDAIAARCGFASPSHFHRAFKRAHAMPPGEWRRAHRS